ncbi:hypothetical protein NC651_021619 [Populus alba x Populus x berolinensis]|nr:hypothetical protein NC651_021619 [Populus alba x Populus x berolinensis]
MDACQILIHSQSAHNGFLSPEDERSERPSIDRLVAGVYREVMMMKTSCSHKSMDAEEYFLRVF